MRPFLRTGRSPLAAVLVCLLFGPSIVVGHVHVGDHDGATQHMEAPHGGHDAVVADTPDRIPSTQVKLTVQAPAVGTYVPTPQPAVLMTRRDARAQRPPARAPPRSRWSRAPPSSL